MMSFASVESAKPTRRRRFRWAILRGFERRLFLRSKTAVSTALGADKSCMRPSVPLRCPVPVGGSLAPEKRLMVAVLDDALMMLARHGDASDRQARKLIAEVDAWIAADDLDWPFSFVNICDALHLDASCVRSRLERWRRGRLGLASPPPSHKCRRAGTTGSR